MGSLVLAVFCSASIALIFKKSEGMGLNRYVLTSANYMVATLVSVWMTLDGSIQYSQYRALDYVFAIGFGLFSGVFFFLSFAYYQKSVKTCGAGLAGTFAKMGILIPMILSIAIWAEWPLLRQWAGIFLAISAVFLASYEKNNDSAFRLNGLLVLLFFFGGMAEFSTKIFQKYGAIELKSLFLTCVFFSAFLVSTVYALTLRSDWDQKALFLGGLVGIPNLFSSFFLIKALTSLSATIVFPIYSASSILLIALGSGLIFGEKINKRGKCAIGLTVLAMFFI